MKIVPKDNKLINAIKLFIVAFLVSDVFVR